MRVQPLSTQKIRSEAQFFREMLCQADVAYFPVVQIVEWILPEILADFSFEVNRMVDMKDDLGLTYPDVPAMLIREDVYDSALAGEGYGRFTFGHELGHLILHQASFARTRKVPTGQKIKSYEDPEWQANTFAAELLMPTHIVAGKNVEEISQICGVSKRAASVRRRKLLEEANRSPNGVSTSILW